MTKHWDDTESMPFVFNDGGRAEAGFKGKAGDCVARAISIASGQPYAVVYAKLAEGTTRATRPVHQSPSAPESEP